MSIKKLRAKDLKHDEVREEVARATGKFLGFTEAHRRPIVITAGAVLVAAVAVVGVMAWNDARQARAEARLGHALRQVAEASQADAVAPDPTARKQPATWPDAHATLLAITTEHAGTRAAVDARYYLGVAELRMGKAAEAAATLQSFTEAHPGHWLTPLALAALAAAHEEQGDVAAAEVTLKKASDGTWRSMARGESLLLLAELYERHDQVEKARATYAAISASTDLADSPEARAAKAKLEALESAGST
jgi:TolA-binding protein